MIGQTLGHYRIEARLGAGGMGEVYRAHDLKLDRAVALKFIHPDLVGDPKARSRFEREARSLAVLDHPYVGAVHGFEEVDRHLFMVLAYIEGVTLESLIRAGPIPADRTQVLLTRIAEGLAAAHGSGIVHRDIKSTNIMVGPGDVPRIVDFGLALRSRETRLTQTGMVSGTPAFMAPEVLNGATGDKRSDVFSLGVVFYEVLTGTYPFLGENAIARMHAVVTQEPRAFPEGLPASIRALESVVKRCLMKSPAERFNDAGEVVQAIAGEAPTVALPASGESAVEPTSHTARPLWVAGALAVVVVLAVIAWFARSPPETVTLPVGSERSVAVLAFQNVSGDPDLDWLQRGVGELVSTALSQSRELNVYDANRMTHLTASTPSTDDDGPDATLALLRQNAIGRAVVGSILQSADRLLIQGRVLDVNTGQVLHSEVAEGEVGGDVFQVVGQLVGNLQKVLEVEAVAAEQPEAWLRGLTTRSPQAYRWFIRGREALLATRWADAARADEQALAIDPNFIAAHVDLLGAYWNLGDERLGAALERVREMRPRATAAEALQIDLAEAVVVGDPPRLIRAASQLVERYPENRFFRYLLGRGYYTAGDHDRSYATLKPLAEARYEWPWTYILLAESLVALGREAEAESVFVQGLEVTRNNPDVAVWYGTYLFVGRQWEQSKAMSVESVLASPDIADNRTAEGHARLILGKWHLMHGDSTRGRAEYLKAKDLLSAQDFERSEARLSAVRDR